MNLFWRAVYFFLAFVMGFVNPVITFLMIIVYYLPSILDSAVKYDERGGPNKKELTFDIGDAFLMGCYDMREHDYTYIQLSQSGKIVRDEKPIKKIGGLQIGVEKFE